MIPQAKDTLNSKLIQTIDTEPIPAVQSAKICTAFNATGFKAVDIGHHIVIYVDDSGELRSFAWIYLVDASKIRIAAIAQRWWLLFLVGDRENRYDAFWQTVDGLLEVFETIASVIEQGTIGELEIQGGDRK